MGLEKDTGTTAGQFSNLALVFYVTYFAFEIPQGIGMQRFPTGKWIGMNVVLWVCSLQRVANSVNLLTPYVGHMCNNKFGLQNIH